MFFFTPARRASWWLSIRFLWRWITIVGETPFSFYPTNLKNPFQTALGDAKSGNAWWCLVSERPNWQTSQWINSSYRHLFFGGKFGRKGLPVVPRAKQSVSVQISIFLDPCFPFFWKPCWAQSDLNVQAVQTNRPQGTMDWLNLQIST